ARADWQISRGVGVWRSDTPHGLKPHGFSVRPRRHPRESPAAALPSGDALLEGGVVAVAPAPQDAIQRPLLGRSRPPILLVGFARHLWFHRLLFCLIDKVLARARANKRLTARVEIQRLAAGESPSLSWRRLLLGHAMGMKKRLDFPKAQPLRL